MPIAVLALAVFLGLAPVPRGSGVLPGEFSVPLDVTSALPACGNCHDPSPNANGAVRIDIEPSRRSLDAGAPVPVTVRVSGGPGLGSGGFTMVTDRGAFAAGPSTRVSAGGDAITHNDSVWDQWTFDYQAPATAGLVEWTAAGQSANGDGTKRGDSFGFWGPDSGVPGVPLRLYVNGPQITALGDGCVGTGGHVPVLGAGVSAAVGQAFDTEVHAVPPGAPLFFAFGDPAPGGGVKLPFDLGILGAPGCVVQLNLHLVISAASAGSGSGGGSARFSWPLPNDPGLRGAMLYFQSFVIDPAANRLGLTVTNALVATVL